jgi:hypothetical protein
LFEVSLTKRAYVSEVVLLSIGSKVPKDSHSRQGAFIRCRPSKLTMRFLPE